jgi:23S rRNA (cytosine1962-C5)-methyltransferase
MGGDRRDRAVMPSRASDSAKQESAKVTKVTNTNDAMAAVTVSRQAIDTIRRGHPWIYRSNVVHISSSSSSASRPLGKTPGVIVQILDQEKRHVGAGVLDAADSPLAVRVWTSTPHERLDAKLFRSRLETAIQIRSRLFPDPEDTNAYRILNGEGDRAPAFVVDRYKDVAVLRMDGEAARSVSTELLADIESPLRAIGITTLLNRGVPEKGKPPIVTPVFGPMREKVEAREYGVPFLVDLVRGQKTGAFLDQRDNRRRIGELVKRRDGGGGGHSTRVLNLFSYTGGFSVRAALAGGIVTSVDVAAAAHATAQESFRLAGLDPKAPHVFSTADAFQFLERAAKENKTWDVIISDPPSFAPNAQSKPKAISAYRALHRACVNVLAPQGTFVAASCSSHISAEDFMTTLDDGSLGGRSDLRVLELHGPPPDHPTLATFFEGRYLKLAILE